MVRKIMVKLLSVIVLNLSILSGNYTASGKEAAGDSLEYKLASGNLSLLEKFRILDELARLNWKVSSAKSIAYGKQGLEVANQLGNDSCRTEIMNNLGVAYYYATSFEISLDYFLKSLDLAQKMRDQTFTGMLYNSMANVYLATNQFEKAMVFYQKSLEIRKKRNDKTGMAANYINISRLYSQTGKHKEAWGSLLLAIGLLEETGDSARLATAYNNLGEFYRDKNEYQKALLYHHKALKICSALGQSWEIAYIMNSLGEVFLDMNRFDSAKFYVEAALQQARKISSLDVILYSFRNLTKYYSATGNYKSFMNAFEKYNSVRDSIFSSQVNNSIAEMQVRYETEAKEKENVLQKLKINRQQNLLNSFIFTSILILVVVVVLFYMYRAKRMRSVLLESMVLARTSELQKSEQLYRMLIDTMPDAVVHVNPSGIAQYISDHTCALFSLQNNTDMIDSPLDQWVEETDRPRFSKLIENVLEGKSEFDNQFLFRSNSGKIFPGEINLAVQKDQEGCPTGMIAVIRDVTERKLFEQQILKNTIETEERERTRFSEDLHDGLGPLLSTVKIHMELIRSKTDDRDEQEKYIRMANELLDEAIRSTKEIANNLSPNVLNDFGLVEALKVYIEKINRLEAVRVQFQVPAINIRPHRDIETALYRISLELINNTLKHAQAGQINIALRIHDHEINYCYSDDGVGMDWGEVTSRKARGLGLSGIISRVKSLNGDYLVVTQPGEHFRLEIKIPVISAKS